MNLHSASVNAAEIYDRKLEEIYIRLLRFVLERSDDEVARG